MTRLSSKTVTTILADLTKVIALLKRMQTDLAKYDVTHLDTLSASTRLLEIACDEIEVEHEEDMEGYRDGLS